MSSPPATPFEPFEPSLALSGLSLLALRFCSGVFLALAPCGDGDGENKNKDYPASLTRLGPLSLSLLKKAHAHRPALPSQSIPKYVCTVTVRTQSTNLTPYRSARRRITRPFFDDRQPKKNSWDH